MDKELIVTFIGESGNRTVNIWFDKTDSLYTNEYHLVNDIFSEHNYSATFKTEEEAEFYAKNFAFFDEGDN
jgi:hypothetical protein